MRIQNLHDHLPCETPEDLHYPPHMNPELSISCLDVEQGLHVISELVKVLKKTKYFKTIDNGINIVIKSHIKWEKFFAVNVFLKDW